MSHTSETNGNGGVSGWLTRNWRAGIVLMLVVSGFTSLKSDVSYIATSVGEIKVFVKELQEKSVVYRLEQAEKEIETLKAEVNQLQHPTKK